MSPVVSRGLGRPGGGAGVGQGVGDVPELEPILSSLATDTRLTRSLKPAWIRGSRYDLLLCE
jgi:hypothetical protein